MPYFQSLKKKKTDPSAFCGFCQGTAQCNKDGEEEELVSCADCGNSGKIIGNTVWAHKASLSVVGNHWCRVLNDKCLDE